MKSVGIYIHIPFCIQKCLYCDFNSIALKDRKILERYLSALKKDLIYSVKNLDGCTAKSIYFGGGTPSLLRPEDIFKIIQLIEDNFRLSDDTEVTLETNPATVSDRKLLWYKQIGINRISLGVQSFNDKYLKILGRIHTNRDTLHDISLLRKTGFDNVSIDLIYGLPGQTQGEWKEELKKFIDLDLAHISFYDLKIERNTSFYRKRHSLRLPDNDTQTKMYTLGCRMLERAGYKHYEISSFAKDGFESYHNQIYWKNNTYLGFGAGAYSYIKGVRFRKVKDVNAYIKEAKKRWFRRLAKERLTLLKRAKETLALNFRLLKGVPFTVIKAINDLNIRYKLENKIRDLTKQGLIKKAGSFYKLTGRGILFYDTVASEILAEEKKSD